MSRTDHPRLPHRKGANAHRVGHANRSYREHGKGDYLDWGTPRARHLALPSETRRAIAEGLADLLAEPTLMRTCWDLGAEYDLECAQAEANLLNGEILADLIDMTDVERRYLEHDGHTNHLRRTA